MNMRFGEAALRHTTEAGWKKRADLVAATSPDAKVGERSLTKECASGGLGALQTQV